MNIKLIINETLKVRWEANTFKWAMKTSEWVHKKLAKLEQWRGEVVCLQQAGRPLWRPPTVLFDYKSQPETLIYSTLWLVHFSSHTIQMHVCQVTRSQLYVTLGCCQPGRHKRLLSAWTATLLPGYEFQCAEGKGQEGMWVGKWIQDRGWTVVTYQFVIRSFLQIIWGDVEIALPLPGPAP